MTQTTLLKLNIKQKTLYINESESVIGIIFFSIGEYCFPSNDWYDFVVALLIWLSQSLAELHSGIKKIAEMPFMEGPFKIAIFLKGNNQCVVNFIEGEKLAGDKEIIHKSTTIPFHLLIDEVIRACRSIMEMRKLKEIEFVKDYEDLEIAHSLLNKCKKEVSNSKTSKDL